MGTRSLLGYELPNGKIYSQYLQFDGYPESKGKDYYLGVLKGLQEIRSIAVTKSGKPSRAFFTRIKNFLNEVQYSSGHSVNNHMTVAAEEWFGLKVDSWQEWQYLFTREGDFIFHSVNSDHWKITIPWNLTKALIHEDDYKIRKALDDEAFWKSLRFSDRSENEMVLSWGKDAALHVTEELDYESSKTLRDEMLKGNQVRLKEPILSVETDEVLAFPEQGDHGWRSYAILNVNGTFTGSMFWNYKGARRNQKTFSYKFEHVEGKQNG